ncbi:uncharacterized protein EI97DRAFT_455462 [Westerdykella ornata]|uniref:Uncharacterized protein n=1 Tax=Westerdykella ornata TaxID=318751 RepID=A0A6A6JSU6_WESOR|nr:uncharacterized protein EI97DRAFT_455462 [Westerdykella ornata]KAF2279183.1 hypothetical protein EI97DRAFT_455462 [Westerdykella ornata]
MSITAEAVIAARQSVCAVVQYWLRTLPNALKAILVHAPPLSQNIKCAIRVHLEDRSCACLLTSSSQTRVDLVMGAVTELFNEGRFHPVSMLQIILDDRFAALEGWFEYLRTEYGASCMEFLKEVEDAQGHCGYNQLSSAETAALTEPIAFTLAKCDFTNDKLREVISRIEAQINVSFSLVAQEDSSINLFVAERSQHAAELAASDSRVMKVIAFMTLVFLPCSLVTSIWDAELVKLEGDKNWKIYLVASLGSSVLITALGSMLLLYRGRKWTARPGRETRLKWPFADTDGLPASPLANIWQRQPLQ